MRIPKHIRKILNWKQMVPVSLFSFLMRIPKQIRKYEGMIQPKMYRFYVAKVFFFKKSFADKAICKLCFDEECFRYTFSDKTIYWCIFIECQTVKSMFCFTLLCSTIPTMVQCTAWSCIQMEVAKKVRCPSVFPVITEWRMADGLWHKAKGCYP